MKSPSSLVEYLWVGPGAYPRVELQPYPLTLEGWKGLPGTTTLAYYKNP
jgi:hypothetical protein